MSPRTFSLLGSVIWLGLTALALFDPAGRLDLPGSGSISRSRPVRPPSRCSPSIAT
jgi:hypothetical protein